MEEPVDGILGRDVELAEVESSSGPRWATLLLAPRRNQRPDSPTRRWVTFLPLSFLIWLPRRSARWPHLAR